MIRNPHAAHLLEREGPVLGFFGRVDRTPDLYPNMTSKKIKLVNVVQVMLFRRILPCQRRAFDLWEFDSAKHQTLRELYDMMHEDVWRVLFKGVEVPPSLTEDRRLNAKRRTNPVSFYIS